MEGDVFLRVGGATYAVEDIFPRSSFLLSCSLARPLARYLVSTRKVVVAVRDRQAAVVNFHFTVCPERR